jgi:hypothetical protein
LREVDLLAVTLERHIEDRGTTLLVNAGCVVLKLGQDGWPDRQVIWAPGRHFYVEYKAPGKGLTKAQKIRIPKLREMGEPVYIIDKAIDVITVALATERRTKR